MQAVLTQPVFQMYAASAVTLGMNLLVLANNTALSRAKADEIVNPEDRAIKPEGKVVYEDGNASTERYRRAHRNALENIPLFLITGFLLSLTGISFLPAAILFGIFVAARLFHSYAYILQLQPWRTASFAVGAIDQVVILGFLLWHVFVA
jgi:uncharacterized membrane protein YecN with MAPEG domain